MSAKQLIEALQDGGKLPADLIRDWISGSTSPGHDQQQLHEAVTYRVEVYDLVSGGGIRPGARPMSTDRPIQDVRVDSPAGFDKYRKKYKPPAYWTQLLKNNVIIKDTGGTKGQVRTFKEDVGGDVELPTTPADPMQTHPQEEPMSTEPSMLTFTVESAEQQTTFREMVNALDAAQVRYKLNNTGGNEWEMVWYQDQDQAVESVLEGLGIEYDEDDTPEALVQFYGHGAENMSDSDLAIEALLHGADSDEIIDTVCEAKKKAKKKKPKAYKPGGWIKKALKKGGSEFSTTQEYPTEPEAKRAIIAGLLHKIGKASTSGGQ